jgi:2-haloacid dehalogenase
MLPLDSSPMNDRWATFDCYGTLIDWNAGLRSVLERLWPGADGGTLLARYHELEPVVEAGRGVPYRQVLAETLARVADAQGLAVPAGSADALAESLPSWPVFPDVPDALRRLRAAGWSLAILSNTDADLLGASLAAIDVPVELRVVASEVGSYKPAPGHWESFFARSGAERARHVHVAASLYHDVAPCAEMGLRCVWLNRLDEVSDLARAGELTDLSRLPARLEQLVPAG